jgi:hypothetical protein
MSDSYRQEDKEFPERNAACFSGTIQLCLSVYALGKLGRFPAGSCFD